MNGNAENHYDVVIIGAGISGINAGYRVQTQCPGRSYAILESRNNLGGTWDFWKYPGIRSDSDLYTFGFPWRPWPEQQSIADGPSIIKYLNDTASMFGIDKKIRLRHKLLAANWSSKAQQWTLTVEHDGEKKIYTAGYIIFGTGYYDYENPLPAVIPGIDNFKGEVVHPQFWPENLDYTDKKIVVIGSGATAVTLLPALAQKAAKVTMLQRTPTYVMSLPSVDNTGWLAHKLLPAWLAFQIVRVKFLVIPFLFFRLCRAYPNAAKRIMRRLTKNQLPDNVPWDPHFNPQYNPWEQRLCVCPDGDFYRALQKGRADVVTGHIKTVRENDILLENGESVEADIVVTATGLKIQLAGGADISVDGVMAEPGKKFLWRGVMLQDLPNASFIIGYTNASWTLGADATAQMATRILNHMRKNGYSSVVPRLSPDEEASMTAAPMMNLKSTYLERAKDLIPKSGDKAPWMARSSYFRDMWDIKFANLDDGLEFRREGLMG
ncbi:monooxygenase flavin-binding family protein-like protein [Rhizodiscina lignyota]|uniref:Monooxygenase flavin-binding family protein-like protein n=1 Tax=Rhizodiscina lignyota TaxID=1504668 RepID=A0A9P4M579_9PEZI|nr:monooxygenase flavin-binding family protein-like protein [Rhizodiscina lignyota]